MKAENQLAGDMLVTTLMSNLGLERHLENKEIKMVRTAVGDRYVVEAMKEQGANLGGEQSGHILFSDYATSGDGLLAALQVLRVLTKTDKAVSEQCRVFDPVPQILKNVIYDRSNPIVLDDNPVKDMLGAAEQEFEKLNGRLLVRVSGTEPKIRFMGEGDDLGKVESVIDDLVHKIKSHIAA